MHRGKRSTQRGLKLEQDNNVDNCKMLLSHESHSIGLQRNPLLDRSSMKEQCSATATALVSACEPRGCACNDSSLSSAYACRTLALLRRSSIESVARYLTRKIPFWMFLKVGCSLKFLDHGLGKVGWSQVQWSITDPDACRRRRRHPPPMK